MTTLRELMPSTAKRVDALRKSVGVNSANEILRKAMNGEINQFFSIENGHVFGCTDTTVTSIMTWNERDIPSSSDPRWMTEAMQLAAYHGIEFNRADMNDPDETRELARKLRKLLKEKQISRCSADV